MTPCEDTDCDVERFRSTENTLETSTGPVLSASPSRSWTSAYFFLHAYWLQFYTRGFAHFQVLKRFFSWRIRPRILHFAHVSVTSFTKYGHRINVQPKNNVIIIESPFTYKIILLNEYVIAKIEIWNKLFETKPFKYWSYCEILCNESVVRAYEMDDHAPIRNSHVYSQTFYSVSDQL